jgi:HEAT repeat protein
MNGSQYGRDSGKSSDCSLDLIRAQVADLVSKDKEVRTEAHNSLVSLGESAALYLVEALASVNKRQRLEAMKVLEEINPDWPRDADAHTIRALVAALGSRDDLIRIKARKALVTIGAKAVSALEEGLASKSQERRWESAKALEQISDPRATAALIKSLEDEMFDVRWLSAEGLIMIGWPVLIPLLRRLTEKPDSLWLREGAHHILHGIDLGDLKEILLPVRKALEDVEAELEAPFAAEKALESLERIPASRAQRKHG